MNFAIVSADTDPTQDYSDLSVPALNFFQKTGILWVQDIETKKALFLTLAVFIFFSLFIGFFGKIFEIPGKRSVATFYDPSFEENHEPENGMVYEDKKTPKKISPHKWILTLIPPTITIAWFIHRVFVTAFYSGSDGSIIIRIPADIFNAREILFVVILVSLGIAATVVDLVFDKTSERSL